MRHFVFGMFAIRFPLLVPAFIVYQVFVDIYEFLAGFVASYVLSMI